MKKQFRVSCLLLSAAVGLLMAKSIDTTFIFHCADSAYFEDTGSVFVLRFVGYLFPFGLFVGSLIGGSFYQKHVRLPPSGATGAHYVAAVCTSVCAMVAATLCLLVLPCIGISVTLANALLLFDLPVVTLCFTCSKVVSNYVAKLRGGAPRPRRAAVHSTAPGAYAGVIDHLGYRIAVSIGITLLFATFSFLISSPLGAKLYQEILHGLQHENGFWAQTATVAQATAAMTSPLLSMHTSVLALFVYFQITSALAPARLFTPSWLAGLLITQVVFFPIGFLHMYLSLMSFAAMLVLAFVLYMVLIAWIGIGQLTNGYALGKIRYNVDPKKQAAKDARFYNIWVLFATMFTASVVIYSLGQLF